MAEVRRSAGTEPRKLVQALDRDEGQMLGEDLRPRVGRLVHLLITDFVRTRRVIEQDDAGPAPGEKVRSRTRQTP